jgi:hypothetical protein
VTVSQADVTVARMFPYYICTVIFLMPYLAAVTYYPLQVSFYIDQVGLCGHLWLAILCEYHSVGGKLAFALPRGQR